GGGGSAGATAWRSCTPAASCRTGRRPRAAITRSPASSATSSPPPCRESARVLRCLAERRAELALLTAQHLRLVLLSTAVAVAIGVPVGILLARRPRWARPVLGAAGVL